MVPEPRLPRCAAASMPRAKPETVMKPAWPRSRARRSAKRTPAAEALRAPTIAIMGSPIAVMLPRREERRRAVNHSQAFWISCFPHGDKAQPQRLHCGQLALGIFARIDARRSRRSAPSRKLGQRIKRAARAAVSIQERSERTRADMLAANEAQPIEPLLVVQCGCLGVLAAHVIPSRRVPPTCPQFFLRIWQYRNAYLK
jgi:hypothetical protein